MDGILYFNPFEIRIIKNTLSRNPLIVHVIVHVYLMFQEHWNAQYCARCTANLKCLKISILVKTIMKYFVAGMSHLLCGQLEPKGSPQPRKDPNRSIHPPQLPCFMPSLGGTPLTIHKKSPQVASSIGGGKGEADLKMTLFPICLKISFVQNNNFRNIF